MTLRTLAALLVASQLAAPAGAEEPPAGSLLPPEETFVRTMHAARRDGPIDLDGKLDEPAWQASELGEAFTQARPDEGAKPSVQTRFRVLWDDEAIYVGAECDDPEPSTDTLSRRDRFVEGDYVSFDFDTTLDKRTAYHFQVFSAGQQLDGIHYNDTNMTTDWDGAWESAVAHTAKGWSFEARIPLRLMRVPDRVHAFGFNIYRSLSRRHEEDQWRYRPIGRQGDISRLGLLEGIDGIHPVRALELRPYAGARLIRTAPAPGTRVPEAALGACSSVGLSPYRVTEACFGLDLRYNLASDLALVGTINPDFGQVEADQRVLNLSTFETFFPEKRPFFLEGIDLFKPALRTDFGGPYGGDAYQLFYSRRIGRGTPSVSLNSNQSLVFQPSSVPVVGAAKVTGTVGAASVGVLSAIEPRVSAQVETDGHLSDVRAAEARSTALLRVRAPVADGVLVGVTGTAVDPFFADASLGLSRRHAHVGEADLTLFDKDRSWNFNAQGVGSLVTGNEPETRRDGTFVGSTASGFAGSMKLSRSGEYLAFALFGDLLTPTFTVNDLGFLPRANLARAMGYVSLRDPHPNAWRQNIQLLFGAREVRDASFANRLERDALLELNFQTNSFWFFNVGVIGQAPYVDDRELLDGTPLERQPSGAIYGFLATDSRKPLGLDVSFTESRSFPRFERQNQLDLTVNFRPLPQFEGNLGLSYNENAGTIRQIRGATLDGSTDVLDPGLAVRRSRVYLLAQQQARSVSATLRSTYAFTPYLTLQAYAQLFTAGITYGGAQRALVAPGKGTVRLDDLRLASAADRAPDGSDRQAGLNLNLILRWEWRTGSTLYLVYAHQSSNDLSPLQRGLDFRRELSALTADGVSHGDTVLVKVDLLTTL